eukprot:SAG25_NODE_52_length_18732_cov_99.030484_1_plen_1246_part_10
MVDELVVQLREWAEGELHARQSFEREALRKSRAQAQGMEARLQTLEHGRRDFEATLMNEVRGERDAVAALQHSIADKAQYLPFAEELSIAKERHAHFCSDFELFRAEAAALADREQQHAVAQRQLESAMRTFNERYAWIEQHCKQQAADVAAMRTYLHDEVSWSRAAIIEVKKGVAAQLKQCSDQLHSGLEDSHQRAGAALHASLAEIRHDIARVEAASGESDTAWKKEVAGVGKVAQQAEKDVASLRVDMRAHVDTMLASLHNTLRTEIANEAAARQTASQQLQNEYRASQQGMNDRLRDAQDSLRDDLAEVRERSRATLADVTETLRELGKVSQDTKASLDGEARALRHDIDKVAEEGRSATDDVAKQLHRQLDRVTEDYQANLEAAIERTEENGRTLADALAAVRDEAAQGVETIDSNMQQTVAELNSGIDQLSQRIDDSYVSCTDQLRRLEQETKHRIEEGDASTQRRFHAVTTGMHECSWNCSMQLELAETELRSEIRLAGTKVEQTLTSMEHDVQQQLLQTRKETHRSTRCLHALQKMMMQPKAPKVFEDLDTNGNGTVSREQLQRGFSSMGADLGDADMDAIVSLLVADSDGDGIAISYREFVQVGTVAKTVDSLDEKVQLGLEQLRQESEETMEEKIVPLTEQVKTLEADVQACRAEHTEAISDLDQRVHTAIEASSEQQRDNLSEAVRNVTEERKRAEKELSEELASFRLDTQSQLEGLMEQVDDTVSSKIVPLENRVSSIESELRQSTTAHQTACSQLSADIDAAVRQLQAGMDLSAQLVQQRLSELDLHYTAELAVVDAALTANECTLTSMAGALKTRLADTESKLVQQLRQEIASLHDLQIEPLQARVESLQISALESRVHCDEQFEHHHRQLQEMHTIQSWAADLSADRDERLGELQQQADGIAASHLAEMRTSARALRVLQKMAMQPKAPKVFEDLDTNGNGTVSREQLQRGFSSMGADLGDADMDAIVSLLVADSDGDDNAISYREFVQVGTVAKTVDSIGDTVQKKLVPLEQRLGAVREELQDELQQQESVLGRVQDDIASIGSTCTEASARNEAKIALLSTKMQEELSVAHTDVDDKIEDLAKRMDIEIIEIHNRSNRVDLAVTILEERAGRSETAISAELAMLMAFAAQQSSQMTRNVEATQNLKTAVEKGLTDMKNDMQLQIATSESVCKNEIKQVQSHFAMLTSQHSSDIESVAAQLEVHELDNHQKLEKLSADVFGQIDDARIEA